MKISICTPTYGDPRSGVVATAYHDAFVEMCRSDQITALAMKYFVSSDLVRVRSRAVRMFLESDSTHLLFWDSDVGGDCATALRLMAAADVDVIGAPYPRKLVRWERIDRNDEDLETHAYTWPLNVSSDALVSEGICEVDAVPMGFTLVSRVCLERMRYRYEHLRFVDQIEGATYATIAMFLLMIDPADGRLLSEDFSFCHRWRAIGGKIHLLAQPLDHVGSHRFRGKLAGLVSPCDK